MKQRPLLVLLTLVLAAGFVAISLAEVTEKTTKTPRATQKPTGELRVA